MDPVAPTLVIEPHRGWLRVNWRELWAYRELLYFLTWRDVKVRYKQTVLGFLWAFLQPFIKLVVFSVIFGKLARIDSEGYPYPIFLYAGLLPWQFFSEALTRSSVSVLGSGSLVTKVYFPRLLVPLSSVGGCLVDFAIEFLILFGLMFYYNVAPTLAMLWVVPLVLLTVLAALGAGVFFSSLTVTFRDVRYIIPFLVQIWMYVTPVIYPVTVLPARWQWVILLNPMSGLVDAWRSAILGKPIVWPNLGVSFAVIVAVFIFGLYYFRKMERQFADVI
ncbi:MAG: ABC transporter permease [Verrucomicrobia bacterium]|nr:ABC transporter permease [Verrucomicrobiota bacterium]MBU1908727.1 ABC transporter permease [Verrucomicrobiota bacterium]